MAEGFSEDAPSIPTPPAVHMTDNKFDGVSDPSVEKVSPINVSFGENDFPRETGHDSLDDNPVPLT